MSWNGLDDFLTRVSDRLDPPHGEGRLTEYGDLDFLTPEELAVIRPAAVLFGVIPRKSGPTALLTLRPDTMANHAGQVAFPGGKIDPIDVDEVAAALREAHEEIGLPPANVRVLGTLPTHETVTSFTVTPVLGHIHAPFDVIPEPGEVDEVFSVPLAHVTDPARFSVQSRRWQGARRHYFTVPFGPYYIWGATARILRGLAERMART